MVGGNPGSRIVRELSLRSETWGSGMPGPETPFCHGGLGFVGEGRGGGTLKKLFCALIADSIGAVSYLASLTIAPRTCLICMLSIGLLSLPRPNSCWRTVGLTRASIFSRFGSSLRPRLEACRLRVREGADEAAEDLVREVRVEGDE